MHVNLSDSEWKLMNHLWARSPQTITELTAVLRAETADLSRVRQKPHQNAAEHQTGKRQIARFHTHHQKRLCAKAGKFASFFA